MEPLGAVRLVFSFTDGTAPPSLSRNRNDKSRMALHFLDLCGTIAIGETFSCGGGLSLMASHRMMRACPAATFSAVSAESCAAHSSDRAETCGPRSTAASISSFDHGRPVSAGQPRVA